MTAIAGASGVEPAACPAACKRSKQDSEHDRADATQGNVDVANDQAGLGQTSSFQRWVLLDPTQGHVPANDRGDRRKNAAGDPGQDRKDQAPQCKLGKRAS